MKKYFIFLALFLSIGLIRLFGQEAKIIRINNKYVLLDADVGENNINKTFVVNRRTPIGKIEIGNIEILKIESGKTAGKIFFEVRGYEIDIGDYIVINKEQLNKLDESKNIVQSKLEVKSTPQKVIKISEGGWHLAKWGMSESDIKNMYANKYEILKKPLYYGQDTTYYSNMKINSVNVDGDIFDIYFAFGYKTKALEMVKMEFIPINQIIGEFWFKYLEQKLNLKYGKGNRIHSDSDFSSMLNSTRSMFETKWEMPKTDIQLAFTYWQVGLDTKPLIISQICYSQRFPEVSGPPEPSLIVKFNDMGSAEKNTAPEKYLEKHPNEQLLKLLEIDSDVTERNEVWLKVAWKMVVKNTYSIPINFNAKIKFLTIDNFIIDEDNEYDLYIPAYSFETYTGYKLINTDVAHRLKNISAEIYR